MREKKPGMKRLPATLLPTFFLILAFFPYFFWKVLCLISSPLSVLALTIISSANFKLLPPTNASASLFALGWAAQTHPPSAHSPLSASPSKLM